MSAVAIPPPTKTLGYRPPTIPPVTTTFDGTPSPEGEPYYEFLLGQVRDLLRKFHRRHLTDDVAVSRRSWELALTRRQAALLDEINTLLLFEQQLLVPPAYADLLFEPDPLELSDIHELRSRLEAALAEIEAALRELGAEGWSPFADS